MSEDVWRLFEDNETSWFSLWSEKVDISYALILSNRNFPDDPLFNHATRISCAAEEVDTLLDEITSHFRERGIPPCIFTSPSTSPIDLTERLNEKGFQEWDRLDFMEYVGGEAPLEEGRVEVRTADWESMNIWPSFYIEAFDIPEGQRQEVIIRSRQAFLRSDTEFYLAYVEGRPVGCAALYSSKGVGGIYCLGTIPEYRSRGVASNLLKAAIKKSKARRNTALNIQTLVKDSLEGLYSRNGFKKVFTVDVYILK